MSFTKTTLVSVTHVLKILTSIVLLFLVAISTVFTLSITLLFEIIFLSTNKVVGLIFHFKLLIKFL
ncbi:MAG: hypothetical protein U9Q66_03030 [Patescibacteria group bacterium]|nr:hypothetical protein [Patescibacteria group bacterium]